MELMTRPQLTAAIALLAVLSITMSTAGCAPQPKADDMPAWAARKIAADEAEVVYSHIEIVRTLHGDTDAKLYSLCLSSPPSSKPNQERCAKIIARSDREIAALPAW
jgi:hypothetical protein